MIKRLLITLCLVAMASASLYAADLPVKISLGIRTNYWYKKVGNPLIFRIENAGKTAINGDQISGIFRKGIIHMLPKDGKEQQYDFERDRLTLENGFVPGDLQPRETSECKLVGNLLTFFPSTKDGVYQVWWTLGDLKSNVLHFTVPKGKLLDN